MFVFPNFISHIVEANEPVHVCLNPLPHMPILGFSSSAAIKDMMSKIWTNEDTVT